MKEHPDEQSALSMQNCPTCGSWSLQWDSANLVYSCFNPRCPKRHYTQEELDYILAFTDPTLLGVKMFLADVRSWVRQYRDTDYVCADFARHVQEEATARQVRCGYAVVHFEESETAHAIVAFRTDYGLKFIEPQSGEEESVLVGRPYLVGAEGIPEEATIRMVEIQWNDGTSTAIT